VRNQETSGDDQRERALMPEIIHRETAVAGITFLSFGMLTGHKRETMMNGFSMERLLG
jgi:hypothetical protein